MPIMLTISENNDIIYMRRKLGHPQWDTFSLNTAGSSVPVLIIIHLNVTQVCFIIPVPTILYV